MKVRCSHSVPTLLKLTAGSVTTAYLHALFWADMTAHISVIYDNKLDNHICFRDQSRHGEADPL